MVPFSKNFFMSEKPTIFERTTQRALATFGIVAAVALLVASCIKKPDNSEIPNASVMAATHDQVQALLTYAIQDME